MSAWRHVGRWLVVVVTSSGCVAFNNVCRPDRSEVVGETLRSLDLREGSLRAGEAPAGNLVADALVSEVTGAELAVVPAVVFERTTDCGQRDFIDRGPLRVNEIASLLPGDDNVVLLIITSEDLKRVLEHSVADLGLSGGRAESPAFLQVGRLLYSVDCSQRPQTLTADGTGILFPGARVVDDSIFIGGQPIAPAQELKLATTSSLAQGGFGYVDLGQPGRLLLDTGKKLREILIDYLRKNSPVEPKIEGRISLRDTCK